MKAGEDLSSGTSCISSAQNHMWLGVPYWTVVLGKRGRQQNETRDYFREDGNVEVRLHWAKNVRVSEEVRGNGILGTGRLQIRGDAPFSL